MLFCRKTDETVWTPPPPPISTNPLFLSNFFMTPFFVQILKTRNRPLNFRGGGGNYGALRNSCTKPLRIQKIYFFED